MDINRDIDPQEWRDVTIDPEIYDEIKLPEERYSKLSETLWAIGGMAIFFVIGAMIASGWAI